MEKKKILYSIITVAGFAVAFVGLRVIKNALLGIGGILVCFYGLIEATHAFTAEPAKKPKTMYSPITPDELEPPTPCPHCGANVPAGNEFCGKCGKKISE